jgi:hypothetical protein
MNRFLFLLVLVCAKQTMHAQYVYTIKADSVKITNTCDTAELIIENHTQTVPGFLYNKGRGRTEFRRGVMALNDSLYQIGGDTINLYKGRVNVTASNGLNATDSHVKLGGPLTDKVTKLQFQYILPYDDEYFKTFKISSPDETSNFIISQSQGYDGDPGNSTLTYNSWRPESNASIGCSYTGFSASAGDANSRTLLSIFPTGAYFVNSRVTIGFPGTEPPYGLGKAWLHLAPGTGEVGTAPLKFAPGTLLTTLENNAIEYDGVNLFFTEHSVRYKLTKMLDGQLTTNFGGASLSAFNSVTTTLTVAGAQPDDVVNVSANNGAANPPSLMITAYVTATNTVTLRAYNASNSAITIASDTYKVRLIK